MNDYFTFFYVKHFELPMCMKCAIQINLPCLALPSHRDHQSICFPITTDPNYPGITLARKTQSFYFLVRETNHSVVRILQTELPSFYLSQKVDVHARITTPCRIPRSCGGLQQDQSQPASTASDR